MDNFTSQPIAKPSLDATTRDRLGPTPTGVIPPVTPLSEPGSFLARNKWFVAVLVLAVVVIAVLAFFAMRKPGTAQDAKVSVDLVVPAEVPSSSEAVVKAIITNNDSRAISEGELELVFPEGAVFVSSNPPAENLSGTSYKIPTLSPGANVTIFTKLRFEGGVGQQRTVQSRLSYKLNGLSAEFSKTASAGLKLVAAGVSIDIQGPATVTNAQLVSYTIHYVNQSTESFDRVRIKMSFPQSFQFAESTPKPSQGVDTWDIGAVVAGAQGDIVLNGTFNSSTPGQGVSLVVQLQVPDKNGSYYTQAENTFATSIGSQPLVVSQVVQGGAQDASCHKAYPLPQAGVLPMRQGHGQAEQGDRQCLPQHDDACILIARQRFGDQERGRKHRGRCQHDQMKPAPAARQLGHDHHHHACKANQGGNPAVAVHGLA